MRMLISGGQAPLRVCYFVSEYPAVSHTFIRREIAELEKNGVSVLRISLRRDRGDLVDPADHAERGRTTYLFEQGSLEYVPALMFAGPRRLFRALLVMIHMMKRSSRPRLYHIAYFVEALLVAKWSREQHVGHIHAHFGTNGAEVAMLAHLLSDIPYSFTVHGPDEFDKPEYLGLAEKVKHAAFVCGVSSFTRSQLCRWIAPEHWPKIALVRCGLDSAFTDPPPKTEIAPATMLTVGRLSGQKGQLILLTALAALAREGVRFKMIIAGDGPIRPLLERRIRELGLEDRVELTGWVSNMQVRSLMLKSRVIVMPSFAEGLPVVLMEALALGRPVITTYVAGIPELVTDRICGWLVPAGNSVALTRAIRECLDAPDSLVLAMGQIGRSRVLDRHDITRECRKLVNLFMGEHMRRQHGSRPDEQRTAEDIVADERVTSRFGAVGRSGEQTVFSVNGSRHGQTWITRH